MSKKIGIYTLGCRVNQYESGAIAELLRARGYEVLQTDRGCDYYIVNTCAVTSESERKSRQTVRRMAKTGKVAVIGCASQLHGELMRLQNVIYIGGCRNKTAVVEAISADDAAEADSAVYAVCPMSGAEYEKMNVTDMGGLFSECRAYIKIEDGCNGKCSYCIIPTCRGRVRSRPFEEVIGEAKKLVCRGYKEIIAVGIEVGAYNKAPLSKLISAFSEIEGLERLRFGSLSPLVITEDFMSAAANSRNFMPHLHLSLQSCCDRVLKDMCRPYRKKDIFERVGLIRKYIPDCQLSADIIVGFPGETEEEYAETEEAVRALKLFHVHSFPYSERAGTKAAEMPDQVPKEVRYDRNSRLIKACEGVKNEIIGSFIGKEKSVLIEQIKNGNASGHTAEYIEAVFPAAEFKVGDTVTVEPVAFEDGVIKAKVKE